ncbi:type II secretion system minor pseudopilin GspI [Pseudomonas lalucatii]|uniref:Type II secretion system protein I n=1 Tax=Pseudomonas lalucatii TaxID=1424203 RepID=A0ABS5Q4C8_9PSED|nr:type II secretion system minor pseudopilin GspI [Pseudomonas lalucatii]MBS7662984.1 type II secretion system minor pseudopilin GspI [Pseudomonas lalucatii]MBS7690076.1 type II secretion system minor pseudopilin GspI [Pseudomonas lalucatii]MBS7724763.1 type II secretion system minor pseudopilin GspI [Pseudomonas lalucatii]QVM87257.1 type II secretion system minor pseudopilin GspI [Pseudomonas lalucatii]
MRRSAGFTLLEVLVALAIFALVAASVLSASSRSLQTASRLEDKTLAMWIADNRLTELQLADEPVADGRDAGELQFAGRRWQWQSEVRPTSEPSMRRVTLWVAPLAQRRASADLRERALVSLSGFLGAAR